MDAAAAMDKSAETSLLFLQEVFGKLHPRNFAVRLWNGYEWGAEEGHETRFTLVLNHPGALRRMLLPLNEANLGEAYVSDDFDIEGEIESAVTLAEYLLSPPFTAMELCRLGWRLLNLPSDGSRRKGSAGLRLQGERHSRARDRAAVTYHYDTSNDFFSSFLDERMQYSCGYFQSARDTIDAAQEQKLDYICHKLRIHPGDRILDLGCGWGGLIMYAVTRFDADAVGITLSQPQADLARERIRQAGLRHLCHVEVTDYRDFNDLEGFHKIVSVGMFEHVGERKLPEYFRKAWDLLKPGGVFLNHGIAHDLSGHGRGGSSFSDRFVFPDGELIPISTVLRIAEACGFEVRDVESLREHYYHTLHHWVKRLEENREIALQHVNEATYRIWKLHMAGSAHRFKAGSLNVYQTLLVKPNHGVSGLPLTREDWYSGEFGELKSARRAVRSKKNAPDTAVGDLFPREDPEITL